MDVQKVMKELQFYRFYEWDIKPLFIAAIKQDIQKTYNIYLENTEILQADDIESSVKATIEAVIQKYDSLDNARLHHQWVGVYGSVRLNEHNDRETKLYVWEHRMSYIVYMLRYAVNGFMDSDYAETNKFMEQNGIKYDTNQGTFKLGNITFRIFKNHNVILKGLTEEQYARIKAAFDNYKKYQ